MSGSARLSLRSFSSVRPWRSASELPHQSPRRPSADMMTHLSVARRATLRPLTRAVLNLSYSEEEIEKKVAEIRKQLTAAAAPAGAAAQGKLRCATCTTDAAWFGSSLTVLCDVVVQFARGRKTTGAEERCLRRCSRRLAGPGRLPPSQNALLADTTSCTATRRCIQRGNHRAKEGGAQSPTTKGVGGSPGGT